MGLLRVTGTIEVKQFWPQGTSDADTAVILVGVDAQDAFKFQETPGGAFRTTHAFEGAMVHGKQGPKAPIDDKGRIRVRLQGIDAPELHYQPSPLGRKLKESLSQSKIDAYKALTHKYRQPWAESSTFALLGLVSQVGRPVIDCEVTSIVAEPTDVFDTYGRLVGDIWIRIGGARKNINQWLVREGWVFPAFYDSMKANGINTIRRAYASGKKKGRVAASLAAKVVTLDFNLVYRSGKGLDFTSGDDQGAVLFPKVYRRLVTWSAQKKAGITTKTFKAHVAAGADKYHRLADFLADEKNATQYPLDTVLGSAGKCNLKPEATVFIEEANSLLKKDNEVVRTWF